MLVKKPLRQGYLAYDYSSPEYTLDEDHNNFENNYITLLMDTNTIRWFASNSWKMPNDDTNRAILPTDAWEAERRALCAYGDTLIVLPKAKLCKTYNKYNVPGYLVWLEFTGPDNIMHRLDVIINEQSKNGKFYVVKTIDGIRCNTFYNTVTAHQRLNPRVAKKLHSIGSVKWSGSGEVKTQFKINSCLQQAIFEFSAKALEFVTLTQLDPYDDFLYKGDPGCLADYELTVHLADGRQLTTRIDLKLLKDFSKLAEQDGHDADLLVASDIYNNEVKILRVNHNFAENIEYTKEFNDFILNFTQNIHDINPRYLQVHSIEAETGTVDFSYLN